MYFEWQTLITMGAIVSALTIVFGIVFRGHKWYLRQSEQDKDIKKLKEENTLLCYGISACLDGLMQLGANHTVPDAKARLDKHLNKNAHQ